MDYELWIGTNPKYKNAIAFQIKMDFVAIRESDNTWKLGKKNACLMKVVQMLHI